MGSSTSASGPRPERLAPPDAELVAVAVVEPPEPLAAGVDRRVRRALLAPGGLHQHVPGAVPAVHLEDAVRRRHDGGAVGAVAGPVGQADTRGAEAALPVGHLVGHALDPSAPGVVRGPAPTVVRHPRATRRVADGVTRERDEVRSRGRRVCREPGSERRSASAMLAGLHRGVAQLGSALRSGRRGRGFKSRHPDPQNPGQGRFPSTREPALTASRQALGRNLGDDLRHQVVSPGVARVDQIYLFVTIITLILYYIIYF